MFVIVPILTAACRREGIAETEQISLKQKKKKKLKEKTGNKRNEGSRIRASFAVQRLRAAKYFATYGKIVTIFVDSGRKWTNKERERTMNRRRRRKRWQ